MTAPPVFSFLSGAAGTGKTFQVRAEAEADPATVLAATTGIAAINLGGTTINSLLRYFDTEELELNAQYQKIHGRLSFLLDGGIRRIVLDEVSMLEARQLSVFVREIERVNASSSPSARMRLTLVGDFAQLPPVEGQFAFEAPEWGRFRASTAILTEPRRQTEEKFLRALHAVRRGDREECYRFFNSRLQKALDPAFSGTTLVSTNREADTINARRLESLSTPAIFFQSARSGEQLPEWKHIPERLLLKKGALVMVLANRRTERSGRLLYVNGDLGTLQGISVVRLQRTGEEVSVEEVTREKLEPGVKEKRRALGSVTYMPLRAAYASTVHKSQGLSLDAVQVDLRNSFFTRCPGMLYVALSRCRTPEGLRLVGTAPQLLAACRVNPALKEWL